jgi:hypothetical protein
MALRDILRWPWPARAVEPEGAEPAPEFPPADEAAARDLLQNDLRQALLERGISGPAAMKWLSDRFQGRTRASALTIAELAEAVKMAIDEGAM